MYRLHKQPNTTLHNINYAPDLKIEPVLGAACSSSDLSNSVQTFAPFTPEQP